MLPIAGNAAEHASAIIFAAKNRRVLPSFSLACIAYCFDLFPLVCIKPAFQKAHAAIAFRSERACLPISPAVCDCRLDISLGVAIGSSTQIALFVTPFCVLVSRSSGEDVECLNASGHPRRVFPIRQQLFANIY